MKLTKVRTEFVTNKKMIPKIQERLKSQRHNAFTEEINNIKFK